MNLESYREVFNLNEVIKISPNYFRLSRKVSSFGIPIDDPETERNFRID